MNVEQAPEWLPTFLVPFFTLSYPIETPAELDSFPDSSYYVNGLLDACLMVTIIAVMATMRDVSRIYILEPFAQWKLTRDLRLKKAAKAARANGNGKAPAEGRATGVANGNGHLQSANGNGHTAHANGNGASTLVADVPITRKEARHMRRSVIRFAEQGWSVACYMFIWGMGLYVHHNLPARLLDPVDVWTNYPHVALAAPLKFYYLLEIAFYCHLVLIINAEAPRKDHWQMMSHHVVTILLVTSSYIYNYTRIGCLVMFIMDWCDIWLALAKMFRYLSLTTICDLTFVWFMISWVITRHGLYIIAMKSTWDAHALGPLAQSSQRWYSLTVWQALFGLLVIIQLLQMMWFWMIFRVAWRVVTGKGAEDTRSDDEDDELVEKES